MAIPAVPPITNFRMFLQKPDGTPLASQWYRITWGREAPLPLARTGTNGLIDVELEGDYSWGLLELGEHDPDSGDDASFVPRIQIDLRLVKPPSPPPKHKRKKIELDSPPPSKPPPAQKPAPEKEKKPEEGEPGESLPPDPTLISMPPDKKPAYDFDPEGRRRRTKKEPEKPKESAGEVERRGDARNRRADAGCDIRLRHGVLMVAARAGQAEHARQAGEVDHHRSPPSAGAGRTVGERRADP